MLSNEGFNDYQNFINNVCMADRYYLQLLNEKDTAWIVQAVSHLHGDYITKRNVLQYESEIIVFQNFTIPAFIKTASS